MKIENKIHLQILEIFDRNKTNKNLKERQWVQKYLGTDKPTKCFSSKLTKEIAEGIIEKNDLDKQKTVELLNSLYKNGTCFEEISVAAKILENLPKIRETIDPNILDNWLNYTKGWAETDVLCQSNFTAKEMLENWNVWEKLLKKFVKDLNIHKRRASIVLLTKPLRQSDDEKLSKLAFENIEKLKHEKEILITKAVSWGLRSLVKFHKEEVKKYLEENKDSLPKIAYREATNKVLLGKK